MPELRWILIVLGLCVVVAIYLWGRRRAMPRDQSSATSRVEPHLADEEPWRQTVALGHDDAESTRSTLLDQEQDLAAPHGSQRILALHIRAPGEETFYGPQLEHAFAAEGLEFGEYEAFHCLTEGGRSLFTVVSMVEPGSFPMGNMERFSTPGLTVFMMISASDGVEALSKMVACARRLASRLDADVLDQEGSTLTNQRAAHMKEEIVEYLRQTRLGTGLDDGR